MENNFKNEVLYSYGGIALKSAIDEEIEDIELAIKYSDHGDDFLLIRTKEGTYEYGWYLNRPGYPDYEELGKWGQRFIKNPSLYYKNDYHYALSNEICDYIWHHFRERFGWFSDQIKEYKDQEWAQYEFDAFVRYINDDVNKRGITYDWTDACIKNDVILFMKQNNIMTDDNMEKFINMKWTSKIDGADGTAGKREYRGASISGDTIKFVYYKGKMRDLKKVNMKKHWDDWCVETFNMSLKQFA